MMRWSKKQQCSCPAYDLHRLLSCRAERGQVGARSRIEHHGSACVVERGSATGPELHRPGLHRQYRRRKERLCLRNLALSARSPAMLGVVGLGPSQERPPPLFVLPCRSGNRSSGNLSSAQHWYLHRCYSLGRSWNLAPSVYTSCIQIELLVLH